MIPTRVCVALDTLSILVGPEDDELEGEVDARKRPNCEAAAVNAACGVLTLYLLGEQEYKDKPVRRARKAPQRRRRGGQGQGAKR